MKKFLLLFLLSSQCFAQNKVTIWHEGWNEPGYNMIIDFNSGLPYSQTTSMVMRMIVTNASICNHDGNLLFYTNGKYIANAEGDTMLNSEGFNPGWETSLSTLGLTIPNGIIIIPFPNDTNLFYVFHESSDTFHFPFYDQQPTKLSYSVVDMTLDSGRGAIVDSLKNIHLVYDTLLYGKLVATRHANGRDWWLAARKYASDKIYEWLITPSGIQGPFIQHQGLNQPYFNDFLGWALFSEDGSKYAMINLYAKLELMDFDRCTGLFSNWQQMDQVDYYSTYGCAFSPNGRFVYVTTLDTIYQYDTWANDINASVIPVAIADTMDYMENPWFYDLQLGPDGKLYGNTFVASLHLYVINDPDSLGTKCNVNYGISLPHHNGSSPPQHPNYDLGALPGSACDTLATFVTLPLAKGDFSFFPNPAQDAVTISYAIKSEALLTITDEVGSIRKQFILLPQIQNRIIPVDGLPNGMYLLTLRERNQVTAKKVMIEK